jgi:hypothetical protein
MMMEILKPSSSRRRMMRSSICPVLVAGEIVVGDEEAVESLRCVGANDLFDVAGSAPPRHAALHVDDGAEGTLIGTTAAGIEARERADVALRPLRLQDRDRRAGQRRQFIHENCRAAFNSRA